MIKLPTRSKLNRTFRNTIVRLQIFKKLTAWQVEGQIMREMPAPISSHPEYKTCKNYRLRSCSLHKTASNSTKNNKRQNPKIIRHLSDCTSPDSKEISRMTFRALLQWSRILAKAIWVIGTKGLNRVSPIMSTARSLISWLKRSSLIRANKVFTLIIPSSTSK